MFASSKSVVEVKQITMNAFQVGLTCGTIVCTLLSVLLVVVTPMLTARLLHHHPFLACDVERALPLLSVGIFFAGNSSVLQGVMRGLGQQSQGAGYNVVLSLVVVQLVAYMINHTLLPLIVRVLTRTCGDFRILSADRGVEGLLIAAALGSAMQCVLFCHKLYTTPKPAVPRTGSQGGIESPSSTPSSGVPMSIWEFSEIQTFERLFESEKAFEGEFVEVAESSSPITDRQAS
eukprot:GHVN01096905.1.p1 GENE.GHVN01096905.1~~GHVN01096905.1.p1  ORF type:complete len:233 (-),score=25.15 GHVN01096905.1:51-749(-)